MANIQKFLGQSTVVFRYTENALRGQIVEGIVSAASGLALPAVVDSTQTGVLFAGDPVSLVSNSTGTGHYVKATDATKICGFVSYETKQIAYKPGEVFTLASTGKVMHMVSSVALTAGEKVYCDLSDENNIVVTNVAASNGNVVGVAEENLAAPAADGALIAVRITVPFTPNI